MLSLMEKARESRTKAKASKRKRRPWYPKSFKVATMFRLTPMDEGCASTTILAAAQRPQLEASVIGAFTFACAVDVMPRTLKLNIHLPKVETRPLDYMAASRI